MQAKVSGTVISSLQLKVEKWKSEGKDISEAETRWWLVDPVLRSLGWDRYELIKIEYPIPRLLSNIGNKKHVDYALLNESEKPVVFVEVKELGALEDDQILQQVLQQARDYVSAQITQKDGHDLGLLVLTDGNLWKFYLILYEGGLSNPSKLLRELYELYELNIETDSTSKVVDRLNKLLTVKSVQNGEYKMYGMVNTGPILRRIFKKIR